jgi:hypothetical protein
MSSSLAFREKYMGYPDTSPNAHFIFFRMSTLYALCTYFGKRAKTCVVLPFRPRSLRTSVEHGQ